MNRKTAVLMIMSLLICGILAYAQDKDSGKEFRLKEGLEITVNKGETFVIRSPITKSGQVGEFSVSGRAIEHTKTWENEGVTRFDEFKAITVGEAVIEFTGSGFKPDLFDAKVKVIVVDKGETVNNEEVEKQVKGLIEKLNADDFEERESATAELIRIGEPALEPVRKAMENAKEPETKMRAKKIITEIEGTLAVRDVVKNWSGKDGKELWYGFTGEREMKGFIKAITKEDKYKGEDAIRMEDVISMAEGGKMMVITNITICRKDKNLSLLYAKMEMKSERENMSIEYKFENGKVKIISEGEESESVDIPADMVSFSSLVRYITTMPMVKGASITPTLLGFEAHDWTMRFKVVCEGEDEITVGKDKIKAYKFSMSPTERDDPGYVWINAKRQFVAFSVQEDDMKVNMISKDEAEKGLAEMAESMKKHQNDEDENEIENESEPVEEE
ncbi:MAG: hypothetical protein HY811_04935 [Planctomycetes bacterium]|nr:hypothetical protein [Planctomycetota bacterium]